MLCAALSIADGAEPGASLNRADALRSAAAEGFTPVRLSNVEKDLAAWWPAACATVREAPPAVMLDCCWALKLSPGAWLFRNSARVPGLSMAVKKSASTRKASAFTPEVPRSGPTLARRRVRGEVEACAAPGFCGEYSCDGSSTETLSRFDLAAAAAKPEPAACLIDFDLGDFSNAEGRA